MSNPFTKSVKPQNRGDKFDRDHAPLMILESYRRPFVIAEHEAKQSINKIEKNLKGGVPEVEEMRSEIERRREMVKNVDEVKKGFQKALSKLEQKSKEDGEKAMEIRRKCAQIVSEAFPALQDQLNRIENTISGELTYLRSEHNANVARITAFELREPKIVQVPDKKLSEDVQQLSKEKQDLEVANRSLSDEKETLSTQNATLRLEKERLTTSNRHLVLDKEQLTTTNNTLSSEKGESIKTMARLELEKQQLIANLEKLNANTKELQGEMADVKTKLESSIVDNSSKSDELETARNSLSTIQEQSRSLREKVQELEDANRDLQQQVIEASNAGLLTKKERMELVAFRKEDQNYEEYRKRKQEKFLELSKEKETLSREKQDAANQNAILTANLQDVQANLQQLQSDLSQEQQNSAELDKKLRLKTSDFDWVQKRWLESHGELSTKTNFTVAQGSVMEELIKQLKLKTSDFEWVQKRWLESHGNLWISSEENAYLRSLNESLLEKLRVEIEKQQSANVLNEPSDSFLHLSDAEIDRIILSVQLGLSRNDFETGKKAWEEAECSLKEELAVSKETLRKTAESVEESRSSLESLQRANAELTEGLATANTSLQTANSENSTLTSANSTLAEDKAKLTRQKADLDNALKRLQKEKDAIEELQKKLEQDKVALEERVKKLEPLQQEKEEWTRQGEALGKEVDRLQPFESSTTELLKEKSAWETREKLLGREIFRLEGFETSSSTYFRENGRLSDMVENQSRRIAHLQPFEKSHAALAQEIEEQNAKIDNLNKSVRGHDAQKIEFLRLKRYEKAFQGIRMVFKDDPHFTDDRSLQECVVAMNDDSRATIGNLSAEKDQLIVEKDQLVTEKEELNTKLSTLRTQMAARPTLEKLNSLQSDIDAMGGRESTLKEDVKKLQDDISKLPTLAAFEELQRQLQEQRDVVSGLRQKEDSWKIEKSGLLEQVKSFGGQSATWSSERLGLEKKVEELNAEKTTLEEKVKDVTSRLDEWRRQSRRMSDTPVESQSSTIDASPSSSGIPRLSQSITSPSSINDEPPRRETATPRLKLKFNPPSRTMGQMGAPERPSGRVNASQGSASSPSPSPSPSIGPPAPSSTATAGSGVTYTFLVSGELATGPRISVVDQSLVEQVDQQLNRWKRRASPADKEWHQGYDDSHKKCVETKITKNGRNIPESENPNTACASCIRQRKLCVLVGANGPVIMPLPMMDRAFYPSNSERYYVKEGKPDRAPKRRS